MLMNSFFPAYCAALSAFSASFVLVEFFVFIAARYRERYLQEAGTELDDVLIQMPASRVLELSLGLSVFGASAVIMALQIHSVDFSWKLALGAAAAVALLLFPVPRLVLRWMKRRRLARFELQLEDALGLISSSLKAGFSINQALGEVAAEDIHPVAVEFRLLVQELQLGVPMEQALDNMCARLGSADFELVAAAISTARQTGGELTYALGRVAELIRGRVRITRKVRALTAMGRLQAAMISVMPFLLLLAMYYISPEMVRVFLTSPYGIGAVALAFLLVVAGFFWIRRITSGEV